MPIVKEHQASVRMTFEGHTVPNQLSQALIYLVCNKRRKFGKIAVIGSRARKITPRQITDATY